jgi:hypothetical protein
MGIEYSTFKFTQSNFLNTLIMLNSQYLEVFQDQLARFAAQDNFNGIITTAFGKQVNQLQLQDLQLQ